MAFTSRCSILERGLTGRSGLLGHQQRGKQEEPAGDPPPRLRPPRRAGEWDGLTAKSVSINKTPSLEEGSLQWGRILSYFSHRCGKILDKGTLREGRNGLLFAFQFEVMVHHGRKAWQPEHEALGMTSTVRKRGRGQWGGEKAAHSLFYLFLESGPGLAAHV